MKHIKLACIFFLLFPFFYANAQIEQEIKSYVDSTEQLINNGRKLLLEEVRYYNFQKVNEIYTFLKQEAAKKQCEAFTYNEHILISVLSSDWSSFTEKAENYNKGTASFCYRSSQIMEHELYEEVFKNLPRVQKQIQTAEISQEDKDLLNLFQYIFQPEKNEKLYGVEVKSFKRNYPLSPYAEFVQSYLPSPSFPASMAFSMGAVGAFPQGNFKKMYSDGIGFALDMDFCINKVYVSLFVNTVPLKLNSPFQAISEEGVAYNFQSNDKFDYFQGGLKTGYYVLRNNHLHLAPYISIGGASLTSDIYKKAEDNDKELEMFNSFFAGPGIHTEFKIYEYKGRTPNAYSYYGYSPPGYFSLKLDAGYNFITNQKIEEIRGNMLYASVSLVWGIGKF